MSGTSSSLYVLNQFGILTQYQLKPHPPLHNSDVDPSTLQLQVEPVLEWDVCRCSQWNPIADKRLLVISEEFSQVNKDRNWLANVEIQTHSPLLRPLWANQQFSFKPQMNADNVENNSPSQPKKIEFQQTAQIQQRLTIQDTRKGERSVEIFEVAAPSAPMEDALKENILDAMTTHLSLSPVPSLTSSREPEMPPFAVEMPLQTEPVFWNQQDLPFDDSYFAFSDNSREEEYRDNDNLMPNLQPKSNSNLYK